MYVHFQKRKKITDHISKCMIVSDGKTYDDKLNQFTLNYDFTSLWPKNEGQIITLT